MLHVQCQISLTDRGPLCLREVLGSLPIELPVLEYYFTFQHAFFQAKPIILEQTHNQNYRAYKFSSSFAIGAERSRDIRLETRTWEPLCYAVFNTFEQFF